jgi:hypothetical protein
MVTLAERADVVPLTAAVHLTVPLTVPDVGVTVSHVALLLADHVQVPETVTLMLPVPPAAAALADAGVVPMVHGGGSGLPPLAV